MSAPGPNRQNGGPGPDKKQNVQDYFQHLDPFKDVAKEVKTETTCDHGGQYHYGRALPQNNLDAKPATPPYSPKMEGYHYAHVYMRGMTSPSPGITPAKVSPSATKNQNQNQNQNQSTRANHHPTTLPPTYTPAQLTTPTPRPLVRITNEAGEEIKLPSRPGHGRGRGYGRSALNPQAAPYQGTITSPTPTPTPSQQPTSPHPLSLAAPTVHEPPSSIAQRVANPPLRDYGFAACAAFLARALELELELELRSASPSPSRAWSDIRATVVLYAGALHGAFPPPPSNGNGNNVVLVPCHEVFPDVGPHHLAGAAVRVRADLHEWVVGVVQMVDAARRLDRAARLLWEAVPDRCTPDGVSIPHTGGANLGERDC
ncbi:hypothetical protein F4775DRAFT_8305 [Biscogniauxia sp. FL1348]|nr:hypothetical protein F4775DRAFT_8305 [Biscogniauxia sp. FL1348]